MRRNRDDCCWAYLLLTVMYTPVINLLSNLIASRCLRRACAVSVASFPVTKTDIFFQMLQFSMDSPQFIELTLS